MYFHRTVQDRTATVWRRCSVAVVVDRWRCGPDVEGGVGPLIRSLKKKKQSFFVFGKKFVKRTVC